MIWKNCARSLQCPDKCLFFFMCMSYKKKQSAEPWVPVLANRGKSYCSSKYFCGLGCLIGAYRCTHTHLHSELISLISLSGSAVTLSCLGQTWSSLPAFRSLGMVAVTLCLDWPLTSLLRTTTPPLSTTVTVSLSLSLFLSLRPLPPISSQPVTLT